VDGAKHLAIFCKHVSRRPRAREKHAQAHDLGRQGAVRQRIDASQVPYSRDGEEYGLSSCSQGHGKPWNGKCDNMFRTSDAARVKRIFDGWRSPSTRMGASRANHSIKEEKEPTIGAEGLPSPCAYLARQRGSAINSSDDQLRYLLLPPTERRAAHADQAAQGQTEGEVNNAAMKSGF
jgi:hypothetical protein